jgi:carbonic anhydrase
MRVYTLDKGINKNIRGNMDTIQEFIKRNAEFADSVFKDGLSLLPSKQTIIISCADPRVDPAHVLGVKQGEAVIIRNVGGRFVPSTMQTMGLLSKLSQAEGANQDTNWNLIFLHHTDCGITHLSASAPDMLAAYFGVDPAMLESFHIANPREAVRIDVEAARSNPRLPKNFLITGMVYDVTSGLVEVVTPAALAG